MKIKHFSIISKQPQELRQFYEKLLECTPTFENKDYCEFDMDGAAKFDIDPKEVVENALGSKTNSSFVIQIEVEKIDEALLFCQNNGFNILTEINKASWGDQYFYLEDPEENLIYIYQKL